MSALSCNRRVAYTDNEIAQLMKERMQKNDDNENVLFERYCDKFINLDYDTIKYMITGVVAYNVQMLEIASDYLDIDYEELTRIIEDDDDVSFRSDSDEDVSSLHEIVNILFSEMIRQKKLSIKENTN